MYKMNKYKTTDREVTLCSRNYRLYSKTDKTSDEIEVVNLIETGYCL